MIGLFIGSFNPPTLAHLNICLKLKKQFKKVVLVPVNSNKKELIDINKRIAMLKIYARKYSFLTVDDIMKSYSYLNYRIIDLLKNKYQNINIIIGSDLLDKLDTFDNYENLLKKYHFIVISRKDYNTKNIIENKYATYKKMFSIIEFNSDISSTKVRKILKEKQNTENVLDQDVLKFIKEHHLY